MSGNPFIEIIRAVQLNGYDLLIKAPRRPEGLAERFFGSADMHILRKCPCPVWMDSPESVHPYRNIVAAVDPVDQASAGLNRLIMDLGSSPAEGESATLHVVHAWRLEGESMLASGRTRISAAELRELLSSAERGHKRKFDELLVDYGLRSESAHVNLIKETASKAITSLCEAVKADLIVMGMRGLGEMAGMLLGSVSYKVNHLAPCTCIAVR